MLFNMTGRPMDMIHIQFIYLIIPIVAYLVFGVSAQVEIMITRSCMVCSLLEFFSIIYRLAK